MVNEQHTVLPETPNNAPTYKQTFDTNPTKCKEGCTPKKTKYNQLQPTHPYTVHEHNHSNTNHPQLWKQSV